MVAVTSSVPSEGKSATSLSMAAQEVQGGGRCIVLDCDLRVANLGRYLGFSDRIGLSDFLVGRASIDEAIDYDSDSGVHFMTAGSAMRDLDAVLRHPRWRSLLDALAEAYDLVILDCPPVLAVSDALLLAPLADTTVYLVRWQQTPRDAVREGLKQLRSAGAHVSGSSLTFVNLRQYARSDYGRGYSYYGSAYRKYYRSA